MWVVKNAKRERKSTIALCRWFFKCFCVKARDKNEAKPSGPRAVSATVRLKISHREFSFLNILYALTPKFCLLISQVIFHSPVFRTLQKLRYLDIKTLLLQNFWTRLASVARLSVNVLTGISRPMLFLLRPTSDLSATESTSPLCCQLISSQTPVD